MPIGLLEQLPGKINDRPPVYKGRDELGLHSLNSIWQLIYILARIPTETLLSSPDSRDWVKISEMFLGPAPEAWAFLPKHKSNSYESQG